jgi:2-polyprenyl-3-methyl-5-hydroxy-6-metoxy-1,4-benzoquinol methylase
LRTAGAGQSLLQHRRDLSETDARPGRFDLMFSRMVFEHVEGVERAWNKIHTLLKPG